MTKHIIDIDHPKPVHVKHNDEVEFKSTSGFAGPLDVTNSQELFGVAQVNCGKTYKVQYGQHKFKWSKGPSDEGGEIVYP